jgi:hypothetical protein
MSKSDHDTYKQESHTIPATSIASVSVTVPRFVRIIRISSLARHLLSADFYLGDYSGQSLISDYHPLGALHRAECDLRGHPGVTPCLVPLTAAPLAYARHLSADLHPCAYLPEVFPTALLLHAAILAFCVLSPGADGVVDRDRRQNSAAKRQSPLHVFSRESHQVH